MSLGVQDYLRCYLRQVFFQEGVLQPIGALNPFDSTKLNDAVGTELHWGS